ncbi:MAG: hypothetical protein NTU81_01125 [Candidatus Nomurabacteria bacterium]|nr:hypothetical protein [Candidatus Nomurabacteria bacterium]
MENNNQIENKIFLSIKEKIKTLSTREVDEIIKVELKNHNYEDWQVDYAFERIKKMIKHESILWKIEKNKIICFQCKLEINDNPKRDLWGFRKYTCMSCNKEILYPLTNRYRNIYWLVLVSFCVIFIDALPNGRFVFPGLLIFVAVLSLIKDKKLCEKISLSN